MIFGPMNENEMKEYLQHMSTMEEALDRRKKETYRAVETLEESIERNSFPSTVREYNPSGVGMKDKVFDILQKSYRDIDRELEEVSKELLQILEEEEKLRYMKRCIRGLPLIQADLIRDLVIGGCNWELFAKRNYISRATVSRRRKTAMKNLLFLYNFRFMQKEGIEKK